MAMSLRLIMVMGFLAIAPAVAAQERAFIIRHAEKEATGADPGLTAAGREMASNWSRMLASAGIDIVLHTDARRSRETGSIIAQALGVGRSETAMADVAGLFDLLEFDHAEDNVLIVAHTETIPGILARLGVEENVRIASDDYRNLFAVTFGESGEASLVRLRLP